MNLTEAMNVYDISLYEIQRRGFILSVELDELGEEITSWVAQKDDVTVYGFSPLSLLALVVVVEKYGENWNKIDTSKLYDKLIDA